MYSSLQQLIKQLRDSGQSSILKESLIGLEKESLRAASTGVLAQTPHPEKLGSALTNPYITTDFSEALTEMITPPCASSEEALDFLADIQQFVYRELGDEILWSTSMPCVVEGEDKIPVADYGNSNVGLMKKIYRIGLGHRYGRTMQVIAGVHFNYSYSPSFWELLKELKNESISTQDFQNKESMCLVRNIQRHGWLIPYLFGASPAVCKSFVKGKQTMLIDFNENTAYEPYATSLRMGDIGYTNSKESMVGIKANYDSLESYVASLRAAINTECPGYASMGVKVDGVYKQLNANILQIENEYYSTVRPKQILKRNEKPTDALSERGIAYVELRSLDVNAFHPLGMNEEQLNFLEVFFLFCLLHESAPMSDIEANEVDMNLILVAHAGRQKGLKLSRNDQSITLRDWADELMQEMLGVAELLDEAHKTDAYTISVQKQRECVNRPELTYSARMLQSMTDNNEGFYHFALRMSQQHAEYFKTREINKKREAELERSVRESINKKKQIESEETETFDTFLHNYFEQ